jgi:hypothetical protein
MIDNLVALKTVCLLKEKQLNQLMSLLRLLESIIKEFQNKNYVKQPYNIILAASDIYYRENYHSDIMAYILENDKNAMKHFINYLNLITNSAAIDIDNFSNINVIREENKIDISIKDSESNHCIIIENKINNAGDMPRQLPRYYNVVKKQHIVDKILYYSLDGKKRPDKSSWTNKDLQLNLDKIISFGAAADGTKTDFINAFLAPCKNDSNAEQEKSFYCQYIDLLEYLRRNQMDYQLMEKFYKEMLNTEQYSSALSIRDMLNEFLAFRRDRLYNYFLNNHSPFEKTYKYSSNDTGYEYIRDIAPNEHIKIDVWADQEQTNVCFFIDSPKTKSDLIKIILQRIGEENNFSKEDTNYYVKIFKFPDDDGKMYKYLEKLFFLLNKNKNSINI